MRWAGLRMGWLGLLVVLSTGARAETIVSLTFDDGHISHRQAKELLAPFQMRATFYIITERVGANSNVLTLDDVRELATLGHEIGSHTLTHRALTELPLEERRRELCDSRAQLQAWGFPIVTLAYPLDDWDAETEQLVTECGYVAARQAQGLGLGLCESCITVEPVPPEDVLAIRTAPTIERTHTLDDLKSWVVAAEQAGGGWLPITFHKLLDDCSEDQYCASPALLRDFLAWLAPRDALGTHVRTVREVTLGEAPPPTTASALQVLAPNGREEVAPGAEVKVVWATVGDVPKVDVAYTVDDGASWTPIATASDNEGSLLWHAPVVDGVRARVRVSSTGEGAVADMSDAPFLIGQAPPVPPESTEAPLKEVDAAPPRGGCSQTASLSSLSLLLLAALAVR